MYKLSQRLAYKQNLVNKDISVFT